LAVIAGAAPDPLLAQITIPSIPLDQLPRPSDQPLPKPPPVVPKPEIVLPPAPAPGAPALSRGARVLAKEFRFVGNTVVPTEELEAIAAPYVGRDLGNAELEELRVALTRRYIEAGYINSGAVIPDQDVSDGAITFRIVEGRLSEIVVGGENGFRPWYLQDRLALGAGPPLNVNDLQERMQLMLQDPQIANMSAELAPGVERGDAVLRVDVTEAKRYSVGLKLSDNRSPVVGQNEIEGFLTARNVFGIGESFAFRAGATQGLDDYSAVFAVPVSARGTLLTVRWDHTNSRVIEAPLSQLDIGANSTAWDVTLSHPLYERLSRVINASVTLAQRNTYSTFLGQASPFIPGAPDGRTRISVVRFGLDGVERTQTDVIAGRVLLSLGVDALNSTIVDNPDLPDSRFTALLGQFQWVRLLSREAQLLFRADGQWSNNPLLGSEKYSIGGMDSVRSYRRDYAIRDKGWFSSLELRYQVASVPVRANPAPNEGAIRLAAFVDYAQAWDVNGPGSKVTSIGGAGPGIRWEPAPGSELAFYWGIRLTSAPPPANTMPDRGLYFRFLVSYAF
ncbi:MAG TPA: ShlB/FhaC/HecB family hemolysin secretion/activation protein, partial [Burkholderiales bacterium]|nr:ShlB/FhaC/HecB family hemolysin secretion/activation protein [Burkholderiales bacterium]